MTTRRAAALVFLELLACGLARGAAADRPASPAPGDEGYLLTTVHGTEPERIPLRFLGTFENSLGPGYDLHLVQLEGPVAERIGVAAGMSGSPVYFGGELLGALSYRLGAMPRDAVGAVTPFADMRRAGAGGAAGSPRAGGVLPIATPIHAGGLAAAIRGWLAEQLEPRGFVVVGGAGGGGAGDAARELRAGGPVGIELARGDVGISATGTVTWIDGDAVYAFGHPFLGGGTIELPMVEAQVVHTLADALGSVKLANTGAERGVFVDDRLTAIVGRRGGKARMIPLAIELEQPGAGPRELRFEVARLESLTPLFSAALVASAITADVGFEDEATLLLEGRVALRGLPAIPVELAHAGSLAGPALDVARDLQLSLGRLYANPFGAVEIERMDFRVRSSPDIERYRLGSVHYDRGPLRPGQRLVLRCRLERRRGAPVTRELTIEVPANLRGDRAVALVVGPPSAVERALGDPIVRRLKSAADLEAFVRALGETTPANRLVAALYQSTAGVAEGGELYRGLPPTAARLLGTEVGRDGATPTRVAVLSESRVDLDGPIEGGVVLQLRVATGLDASEVSR